MQRRTLCLLSLYIPKKRAIPSRDSQWALSPGGSKMLPLSSLFGSAAHDTTSHLFRVAQTHRKLMEEPAQDHVYGGLQLHLPPLFTLPDHTKLLCEHITSYMTSAALAAAAGGNKSVAPPAVLFLRLFPDCTVARLHNPNAAAPPSSLSDAARVQKRKPAQPPLAHTLPLEAFVHAEQPWGAGIDPHAIHQHALRTLEQIANEFGSQYVLVLILPTRLLVSQQFCHDLLELLSTRLGWVNIAFELPSTSALLAPDHADTPSWCRLSLLATPWDQLQRHTAYSGILRHHLSKRTLLPLHVLLPWMMERQMLASMEVGLVVDTIPPRGQAEKDTALIEDRYYTQRHQDTKISRRLREAEIKHKKESRLAHTPSSALGHTSDAHTEEDVVHTFFSENTKQQQERDGQRRAYEAAADAVRERDALVRQQNEENSRRAATRAAEKVWHMHTKTPATTTTTTSSSGSSCSSGGAPVTERREAGIGLTDADGASPLLSLDAPSEELKRLIMQSIITDAEVQKGSKRSTLEKTGQLLSSVCAAASDDSSPSSRTVLQEATSTLEDLLRSPEEKFRAAQEAAQRELRLHTPASAPHPKEWDSLLRQSGDVEASVLQLGSTEPMYGEGYWDCMAVLHQQLPVTYTMCMPTWHAAQVRQWRSEYEAHMHRLASHGTAESPTTAARAEAVPFVHVAMPVLNPATLEAQRLLREGHRRREDKSEASGQTDMSGWLPTDVQELASATLQELPRNYVRREASALMRNYEHDTLFGFAASSSSILQRHGSGSGGGDDAEDEMSFTIRRRHFLRPFWYMHPANVAAQHERAIASLERQKEHHLRADARQSEVTEESRFAHRGSERVSTEVSSYANRMDVRRVERAFKRQLLSDVISAHREAEGTGARERREGVASVIALSVPPPGVSEDDLQVSWNAFLSRKEDA